jgi:thymidylate synthase (FAD)
MKINTTKIVAMTQPLIEGIQTADEFLAYTARVSNPSNQMNSETSEKLLKYLIRNKHWSPFEMGA